MSEMADGPPDQRRVRRVTQLGDREKHVFAQTKRVFGPNRTAFALKPNQTGQAYYLISEGGS